MNTITTSNVTTSLTTAEQAVPRQATFPTCGNKRKKYTDQKQLPTNSNEGSLNDALFYCI